MYFIHLIFQSIYNESMDFLEHLKHSLPIKDAEELYNSLEGVDKHAVLLNTNKISDEEFVLEFPHVTPHPYVKHAYLYDKNEYPLGKHFYHELGYYYLQEPSAMVVSSLIDFKEDDCVLDLCAAPGGKTIQASLKMNGNGLIISNDLSSSRAMVLSSNCERLGLRNVLVVNNDFKEIYHHYLETFDKIILDAPCSGSGMFRKSTLMKEDWSINKVLKFAEIQKELISYAYKMLKPGGLLSYSTCSYSIEEDEEVIKYLLDNTDAIIKDINLKDGYINPLCPIGIRFLPSKFQGEGQYVCHIQKPGESKLTKFKNDNRKASTLVESYKNYDIKKFGDTTFAISNIIDTKGLKIIRYGVKIKEEQKGIEKFDLHYARTLSKDEFPSIELSLEELKLYLEGNQLNKENKNKGYVLLTYHSNSIDIAKTDGRVIKNHYPKGLRRKY